VDPYAPLDIIAREVLDRRGLMRQIHQPYVLLDHIVQRDLHHPRNAQGGTMDITMVNQHQVVLANVLVDIIALEEILVPNNLYVPQVRIVHRVLRHQ
jgi:hypothetical protein